jgi:hypothetical protein
MTQNPSIIGSAITAWRDAFDALGRMGTMTVTAFLLMLVVTAVNLPFLPPADGSDPGLGSQVISLILTLAQSFLMTPLAIAVHRYVLLGEVTPGYALNPSDPRFMRFFGFAVALNLLTAFPAWVVTPLLRVEGYGLFGGFLVAAVTIAVFIFVTVVAIRSIILFPAVAVDALGVTWGNALRDSKGHSWRIFFIMLLTVLPMMIVITPIYLVLLRSSNWLVLAVGVVIAAAVTTVTVTVAALAAMASRLYLAFGNRLGPPPTVRITGPAPA